MARIRSPGYPNASLEQVIEFASKVHSEDRQHPVDRETVARHIGFTGLSGTSDRALSALMHFGLMEKVKKGELRITDLALRILHPDSPGEKRDALHEAGFAPELFRELRGRYTEAPPSRDSLASYLSRSGFAPAAISSATKAYLETCHFLQRERAYEKGVAGDNEAPDPSAVEPVEEPVAVTPAIETPAIPIAPSKGGRTLVSNRTLEPNEIYLDFRGSYEVHVEGILDLSGVIELEEKLKAVKMLLKARPVGADPTGSDRELSN